MEQRKAGYSCISKLKIGSTDPKTGKKTEKEIIDQKEIRDEMRKFYQEIFAKQEIEEVEDSIKEYLNLDNDDEPLKEINSRKLSDKARDSLEGAISLQELTKALREDMKGDSALGIDGFTVNFIREFWTPLGALVTSAVNKVKQREF